MPLIHFLTGSPGRRPGRPASAGAALAAGPAPALAAVAIAGLLASQPPAAGHAAVAGTAGYGDRNGNSTTIRVANGVRNVGQLTVGSARNGAGIQQRTVGVAGAANAQSTKCGKRPRSCEVTQRIRASNREIEVNPPEAGKEARRSGKSPASG